MALIKCWECNEEISQSAVACPRCGAAPKPVASNLAEEPSLLSTAIPTSLPAGGPAPEVPRKKSRLRTVLTLVGGVVALGLVGVWYSVVSGPREIGPSGKPKTRNTICDKGGIVVHEDQYWAQVFKISRDDHIEVVVHESVGPPLDIFLLTPIEFGSFKAGGTFKFLTTFSQGNTREFSRRAMIGAGEYVLVVDNTDVGDAKPPMNAHDDAATVDVRVSGD